MGIKIAVTAFSIVVSCALAAGIGWLYFIIIYRHVIERWGIPSGFLNSNRRYKGTTPFLDLLFFLPPMVFGGFCIAIIVPLTGAFLLPLYEDTFLSSFNVYGCWYASMIAFGARMARDRDLYRMSRGQTDGTDKQAAKVQSNLEHRRSPAAAGDHKENNTNQDHAKELNFWGLLGGAAIGNGVLKVASLAPGITERFPSLFKPLCTYFPPIGIIGAIIGAFAASVMSPPGRIRGTADGAAVSVGIAVCTTMLPERPNLLMIFLVTIAYGFFGFVVGSLMSALKGEQ